jgi:hypothetical protein
MGVAAPHGKTVAASKHASKHAFSLGAAGFAALAFVAIPEDNRNESAASDRQPSRYAANVPLPDLKVPLSVCEMDTSTDPLDPTHPWSPFAEDGAFDIDDVNVLADARRLMGDLPDEGNKETDNMIGASFDSLVSAFADDDERFQNGFGVDMVSQGRYFRPVVHTARRNDEFNARNVWQGPAPAFHGLPYSYAKKRRGRRHHFAEVFISTSIVARELRYNSPIQYVESRGWTFSGNRKIQYRTIKESIFQKATGTSAKLHVAFKAMVNALYDMIEKDGLMDPFTGKPAANFLDKNSFIQKLNLHAQEFQMAVIIVKEFFPKHVKHHHGDIEYWVKEIFQSCVKHKDLVRMFNNIFSLFPNGDDPKLAKQMLENTDAMRDMASQKANSIEFKARYSELLEKGLESIQRKPRVGTKPSRTRHVLLARCRARDWEMRMQADQQDYCRIRSTTIKQRRKEKSGDKRSRPGKIPCCL